MTREPPSMGMGGRTEGPILLPRADRGCLLVEGRAPMRMLQGLLTGFAPPEFLPLEGGWLRGRAHPTLLLDPKGKILLELRIHRVGEGEEGALLLDLPRSVIPEAMERFQKLLPPRFARVRPSDLQVMTLVAQRALPPLEAHPELVNAPMAPMAELLAGLPGLSSVTELLPTLGRDEELLRVEEGAIQLHLVRSGELSHPSIQLIGEAPILEALRSLWSQAGAPIGNAALLDRLRIEQGHPAFGSEIDESTLPPEAGLDQGWIDHRKGCYLGQEVIVRIRDRGRVNRHLRGFLLGELPPPPQGTPLFLPGGGNQVGELRSSTTSPILGGTIALGYLRREIDPPATLSLGSPDGPRIAARLLTPEGWVLVEGDPLGHL